MSRGSPQRRYHFRYAGMIYIGVTIFIAIGALNSQNNLLFWALGLAIGGLLVSGLISGAALMGIEIERLPTADGAVGRPMRLRYLVHNRNRLLPAFALHVVERPAGGGRWTARSWLGGEPHAYVAHVGPRQQVACATTVWPRKRGVGQFGKVRIWTTFPFGIVKKSVTFTLPAPVVVRPAVAPLRRSVLEQVRSRADLGSASVDAMGLGEEFFGIREYQSGDSLRHIAWRPSARTGELLVIQRSAPAPAKLWVVLRFPPTGRTEDLDERALCLTASVISEAVANHMLVGMLIPGARVRVAQASGRRHLDKLMLQLGQLEPARITAAKAPLAVEGLTRGSGCVVIQAGAVELGSLPPGAVALDAASLARYVRDTAPLDALGWGALGPAGAGPEPTLVGRLASEWLGRFRESFEIGQGARA
ncbi:MAG: DUF58 domain-containing protein [Phycisphaerales bacterium JB039]